MPDLILEGHSPFIISSYRLQLLGEQLEEEGTGPGPNLLTALGFRIKTWRLLCRSSDFTDKPRQDLHPDFPAQPLFPTLKWKWWPHHFSSSKGAPSKQLQLHLWRRTDSLEVLLQPELKFPHEQPDQIATVTARPFVALRLCSIQQRRKLVLTIANVAE